MAVNLTPKFNSDEVRRAMLQRMAGIRQALELRLHRVGEQFVADARTGGEYTDQTGNLRSSIGYVILYNGVQVSENFGGKTSDGINAAQTAVGEAKEKFPQGYVLIVVAGMDYAAAVESKGYDVLTASSQKAETALLKAMETITKKVQAL